MRRMLYTMTNPCNECPFLKKMAHGFTLRRLKEFASNEFACHRACDLNEDDEYVQKQDGSTPHCAGALIFNEKRDRPHQMMRIAERSRMYDRTKLNMAAQVR
jgi:hypothetical protein